MNLLIQFHNIFLNNSQTMNIIFKLNQSVLSFIHTIFIQLSIFQFKFGTLNDVLLNGFGQSDKVSAVSGNPHD
jgi:hypothetical protein